MSLIGPEGRKQLQLAARFASAGLELAVAIVVGYLGGNWLDEELGTKPVLQFVGLLLGIVAGFRTLFNLARQAQARSQRDSSQEDSPKSDPQDPPNP
jgi:ATP synthase protein I